MYVYGSHGTATHGSHLEIDAVIWSNFPAYVCDAACFAANQNLHQKFACLRDWVNGLFFEVQCGEKFLPKT